LKGCCDQRLLDGVLRGGKVMETAGNGAEHLWHEFAQQVLGTDV
jgi:hypothetical protein